VISIAIHIRIHRHFSGFLWVLLASPYSGQWTFFSYVFPPGLNI